MKVLIAIDAFVGFDEFLHSILERGWPKHTKFKVLSVLEPTRVCAQDFELHVESEAMRSKQQRRAILEELCERTRDQITAKVSSATVYCEIRGGFARMEIGKAAIEWNADKVFISAHEDHRNHTCSLIHTMAQFAERAPVMVEVIPARVKSKMYRADT